MCSVICANDIPYTLIIGCILDPGIIRGDWLLALYNGVFELKIA